MQKTMKIVLSSLAVLAFAGLLLFFGGDMCADDSYADESGTCGAAGYEDAVTWTYTSSNQTITIGGEGPMADYEYSTSTWQVNSPWYSLRSQIKYVVIGAGVTHIGNYAFQDIQCWPDYNGKGLTFEEGSHLQSIGDYAFKAYNESYMLIYCQSNVTFTIPEGVTTIGKYAFQGERIDNLVLPNSLVSVGEKAFDMYRYGQYNITIGTGLTTVGSNAFTYIKSLTFLGDIPANIAENGFVSQNAFSFSSATQPTPAQVASLSSKAYWYKYNDVTGAATIVGGSTEGNPFNLAFNNQYPWGKDVCEINYVGVDKIDNIAIADAALMKTGTTNSGSRILLDKLTIDGVDMLETVGDKGMLFYRDSENNLALYKIPSNVTSLTGDDFPAAMTNFKLIFGSETLQSLVIPARAEQVYIGKFPALTYLKIDAQVDYLLDATEVGEPAQYNGLLYYCSSLKTVDLSGSTLIAMLKNKENAQEPDFPSSVETVALPDTMKFIGLRGCVNLTSIDLKNVETIRPWGFSNVGFTTVDLKNVKTIGEYAFTNCANLTSIKAENVETIGVAAFQNCPNLESIILSDKCTTISCSFGGLPLKSFTIPKNITFTSSVFANCPLEELKLADGYVGENTIVDGLLFVDGGKKLLGGAFYGKDSIVIPDTVETIASQAFYGGQFKSVTLGNSVTTIEAQAFLLCSNLESIDLKNVTTLGRSAFERCTSLTSFDFKNVTTQESAIYRCTGLESVNFGKLTEIPQGACSDMKNLRIVTAENVTSVGSNAFSECTSLETLVLSEDCTSLGNYFLQNCGLEVFTLPKSMTLTASQGQYIFARSMIKEFRLADGYEGTNTVENGFLLTEDGKAIVAAPLGASVLNIPDTVEDIPSQIFQYSKCVGVIFGQNVKTIAGWVFQQSDVMSIYFKKTNDITSINTYFINGAKNQNSIKVYYWGSQDPKTLCSNLDGKTTWISWVGDLRLQFNTNGGNSIPQINTYRVVSNQNVAGLGAETALPVPTKAGSLFGGWYTDSALTQPLNMKVLPAGFFGQMTLYAKWVQASDLVSGASVIAFSGPSVVIKIDAADVPAGNVIITYSEYVDLAEGSVLFPFAIGTAAVNAGSDTVAFTTPDEKAIATCSISFVYEFGVSTFCTPLSYASAPDLSSVKVSMEIDPGCKILFNGSIINDGDTVEVGEYVITTTGANSILVNGVRYNNSNGTKLFYCGQKLVVKA